MPRSQVQPGRRGRRALAIGLPFQAQPRYEPTMRALARQLFWPDISESIGFIPSRLQRAKESSCFAHSEAGQRSHPSEMLPSPASKLTRGPNPVESHRAAVSDTCLLKPQTLSFMLKTRSLVAYKLMFFLSAIVVCFQVKAQPREAAFNGYCHSLRFLPGTASSAGFSLDMLFTSYDGKASIPLFDKDSSGYAIFSDEVMPSFGEPGVYRTDYVLFVDNDYNTAGTISLTLPTVDTDKNGIADFLQKNKMGNLAISGKLIRQLPFLDTVDPEMKLSGTVVRSAGKSQGTYSITGRDSEFGDITMDGNIYLVNLIGKFKYNRTNNTATVEADLEREGGVVLKYTNQLSYSVSDLNTISFPAGKFSTPNQPDSLYKAFILKRSGNRYIGRLDFEDAYRGTSWADYTAWQLDIADANDSDGDGVPDLSDPPAVLTPPTITVQPVSQTKAVGETAILSVQALGSGPLAYSWRKGGVALLNAGGITGANSPTLSISPVQASHAGNYSVVVSNAAGNVTSSIAKLTVESSQTTSKASAIAVIRGGLVSSVTVTDGGLGYLTEPTVIISGGGGIGATAKAFIESGRVVAIVILNSGSGYTGVPTITIDAPTKSLGLKIEPNLKLTVEGPVGQSAMVEWAGELSGPWTAWSNVVVGTEGTVLVDLAAGAAGRFYRAKLDLKPVGPDGFVWVPPGTFVMGSPLSEVGRSTDEVPHTVTLAQGFWLSDHETTQAEYQAMMGNNPSNWKGDALPVETVSWNDAVLYCQKLTERDRAAGRITVQQAYRLPTESEWEYASRAGTTGARHGELDAIAWWDGNSGWEPHVVKRKQANAWGLYDMLGNVWEWCGDWYGDYPTGSVTDPIGPGSGSFRVVRGGSCYSGAWNARSARRNWYAPGDRLNSLGFRPALSSVR